MSKPCPTCGAPVGLDRARETPRRQRAVELLLSRGYNWNDGAWKESTPSVQNAVSQTWQKQVADALDSFWNPACTAIRDASYHGPANGSDIVAAIAQGLASIAESLRDSSEHISAGDRIE